MTSLNHHRWPTILQQVFFPFFLEFNQWPTILQQVQRVEGEGEIKMTSYHLKALIPMIRTYWSSRAERGSTPRRGTRRTRTVRLIPEGSSSQRRTSQGRVVVVSIYPSLQPSEIMYMFWDGCKKDPIQMQVFPCSEMDARKIQFKSRWFLVLRWMRKTLARKK